MASNGNVRPARLGSVACLGAALLLVAGCATGRGSTTATEPGTVPSAGTPAPSVTRPAPAPGDQAPHAAENNAWKQRKELSDSDGALGEQAAERIRPELERLQAAGDFAPDSTRRALLGLGFPSTNVVVEPMRVPSWWTSPQPPVGVVFAVRVGQRTCVMGDLRPERVLVEVEGSAAEFGCLEPFSH